jgi:hypothetical protein
MLPPQLPRTKTSFRTTAHISCAVASDSLRFSYSAGRQQRRRIYQHGKGSTSIIDQHNLPCRGSVDRLMLLVPTHVETKFAATHGERVSPLLASSSHGAARGA